MLCRSCRGPHWPHAPLTPKHLISAAHLTAAADLFRLPLSFPGGRGFLQVVQLEAREEHVSR